MTRVLFISHWYPRPNAPTDGIFVREHARAVAGFHPVSAVAILGVHGRPTPHIKIDTCEDGNIPTFTLSYSKSAIPRTTWLRRWQGLDRIIRSLDELDLRPELIHANIYSSADLAYAFSRRLGIPAVLSEHATSYHRKLLTPWQLLQARFIFPRLDLIMPVSEDLGACMQSQGIAGRYASVANAVDTELFHPRSASQPPRNGPAQLLMVAALNKRKNIPLVLDAAAALKQSINFHLTIIGDGPERENLELYTELAGLADCVTFLGIQSKPEIAARLRDTDLFLLSSWWENQPVVLLEAMACGVPVVAPRVGGIAEVVPSFCGKLFPAGDCAAMLEDIQSVLQNPAEYNPEAISGYAQSRFSHAVVGKAFSDLYRQVIEARQS